MENEDENKTQGTFYEDKELVCSDCQQGFIFAGGEQRFYADREYSEPRRCKPCRDEKKRAREDSEQSYSQPEPPPFDDGDNDKGGRGRRRNKWNE